MKEMSFLSFYSPLAVGGRSQYLVTRNVGVGTQWLYNHKLSENWVSRKLANGS